MNMQLNRHFTLLIIASGAANEATGVFGSKETGLGRSRAKASAKVVLPAKSTNSSDHKDSTGLSSPKGALLGLASYDSDDDDDADTDSKDKMPISNLSSKDNAGAVNTEGKL
jgi:beta-arabinofuranosyltransferase